MGDLVTLTSGQSPSRFRFGSTGTPYYKVDQLGRSQKYLKRSSTPYFATSLPCVPAGSVLIAKRGGAIALNRVRLVTEPSFMDTNVMALTPGPEIDSEFLYYWLGHRGLWDVADVTSVPQINNKHINPLQIRLPGLVEQRSIAAALGDADDHIAALERAIAKKSAIKQGMEQYFLTGMIRLPGFSGSWEEVAIGDWGVVAGGGVDKKSRRSERRVRLLNYMDVYNAEFVLEDTATQVVTAPQPKLAKCSVRAGDVFFTPTSETPDDIARTAVSLSDLPGVVYSYHVVRWRPDGDWDPSYLAFAFSTERVRAQASTLAAGSGTRYVISLPGFRSFTVMRPPIDEQRAIGECLRSASAELNMLRKRLDKARDVHQGMRQELLTGRTRLPVEVAP
jgi:type I restriction enzyme S subunit